MIVVLHTLSASPSSPAFSDCIRLLGEGDALLLLADGVYAARSGTAPCEQLLKTGAGLYVLDSDAAAAGMLNLMEDKVKLVDFDAFVALTEKFTRQQAWY